MPKLKVKRTITFEYETNYPEAYPNMSLDEAIDFEYQNDLGTVIELLMIESASETTTPDLGCVVRVEEG